MDWFTTRRWTFPGRTGAPWNVFEIKAVPTFVEHIVPPAGDEYAFDVQHYKRHVEVYVSPTGRSVRVFVDGQEVK